MAPMMINLDRVYGVAVHKLQNSYAAREGELRRFVLLHNFIRKFENHDDDIKKDEEDWLDSCLDGLVEEEEDDVMPRTLDSHEPTHFDPGDSPINSPMVDLPMVDLPMDLPIDSYGPHFEKSRMLTTDGDIGNGYGTLHDKDFHPYWKDNSIIASPYQNNRSISIPRIFQRYRLSDVPSHINTSALFGLLSKDPPQNLLKRSKDDLDMLGSLSHKDIDQGVLMDIISMLEYPQGYPLGGKTNSNVASNANIWFVEND